MQCDNCGKEMAQGTEVYHYGFLFHTEPDGCAYKFGQKLWEAAKADKEAKRRAEEEAAKASSDQKTLVEGSAGQELADYVRDLPDGDYPF